MLETTRRILASDGLAATTIQEIARRASVRPAAIYRRWPGRIELIEEAIFPGLDEIAIDPSGDLSADLLRFAEIYRSTFDAPAIRAAMPALISIRQSGEDRRMPEERGWITARPLFHKLLAAASPDDFDRSLDPDDAFDLMVGAIVYGLNMSAIGFPAGNVERMVALICRALRPANKAGE